MKYRVLSTRVEIRGIGLFVQGDEIEIEPEVAKSITGPGGALLEPINATELPSNKETP